MPRVMRPVVLVTGAIALGLVGLVYAQQPAEVEIRGFTFQPAEVRIGAGGSVRWVNGDDVSHSVEMDDVRAGGSPVLSRGQEHTLTFSSAGRFSYHCGIHTTMTGVVIVE